MRRINLGDVVKDTITGFEGVAVASYEYLHGCRRICVQPQALHEGKPIEASTVDEPQLEVVKAVAAPRSEPVTGGPQPEPARRQEPPRR